MMETTFCDGGFPPPWRSSLAISAYEPSPNDLPKELCNQRITYLKLGLTPYTEFHLDLSCAALSVLAENRHGSRIIMEPGEESA
jgi:hypothetical protein